ncbi:MAG: hypothetical protein QM778_31280 [Myxococcales bacterium]
MKFPRFVRCWLVACGVLGGCGDDGEAAENGACEKPHYADMDGDGLGDPAHPVKATAPCDALQDVADNADDLEPTCATNDTDQCGVCHGPGLSTFYADMNGDGRADLPLQEVMACEQGAGQVSEPRELPAGCELAANQACVESAACNTDCTLASCGDKIVNASAGEACDADDIDEPCDRCKTVEAWKVSVAGSSQRFGGLCVTSSAEIYVASGTNLHKIAEGATAWSQTVAGANSILDIGCDANGGVGAVFGGSVQRWAPDGTPAYEPVALGGWPGKMMMQGGGGLVLAHKYRCTYGSEVDCDGLTVLSVGSSGEIAPTPRIWFAAGDVLALGEAGSQAQVLFWESATTSFGWWRTDVNPTEESLRLLRRGRRGRQYGRRVHATRTCVARSRRRQVLCVWRRRLSTMARARTQAWNV